MRSIQFDDMLRFSFLSRPAFSPDGTKIAYVLSRANIDKNGYDSDLRVFDLKNREDRALTFGRSEKFFAWSLDGREIIYASSRNGLPKGKTQFFAQNLNGESARELFTVDVPADSIADLGCGKYLLTAVYQPSYPNPENADYMVIEQVPFLANGRGFVCQSRRAVALYDTSTGTLSRLTPEHMDVLRCVPSDDRTKILLVATDYVDVKPTTNHVYELDLASGNLICLSENLVFNFKNAGYVDGRVIVSGCDRACGPVNKNSKFFELAGGKLTCLTPNLDSSLKDTVGSDCHYNLAVQEGAFARDGSRLIYCATERFHSGLYAIGDGASECLTAGLSTVDNWDFKDGVAAVVGSRGLQLQELCLCEGGRETRLTHHNDGVFEGVELSRPEYLACENDGWEIDGWYMKPVDFEEGKKYPAILNIHGGPKSAYSDVYFHEMQCWAARGFVVIFCNPRGGDGRGDAFADIRGFYGVKDYGDIMKFTQECVARLPFIDAERVGVTGGSYGGYMTNWIITQTHFFKAAAAQRPISNWVSKFGCCDIGYFYVADQHGGRPWENPEQAWQESPLKHVGDVKTPLLLIQSQEDFRCERDQSFQMFTALKVLGVECKMCLFNGENHELSRSGRPRNRLARLREITSWFETHL